jgi:hypothetical protein
MLAFTIFNFGLLYQDKSGNPAPAKNPAPFDAGSRLADMKSDTLKKTANFGEDFR